MIEIDFRRVLPLLYALEYLEGNPRGQCYLYIEAALRYDDGTVFTKDPHICINYPIGLAPILKYLGLARITFTHDMRCRLTSNRQVGREKMLTRL